MIALCIRFKIGKIVIDEIVNLFETKEDAEKYIIDEGEDDVENFSFFAPIEFTGFIKDEVGDLSLEYRWTLKGEKIDY